MRTMKSFLVIGLTLLVCTHISFAQDSGSDKRLALVIGNGKYVYAGELPNPTNDARAMKAALQKVGFDVFEYENLTQGQLKQAIDDFGSRLKNYTIGLVFYAGHGIQSKGSNYLIPVDANLQSEQQIEYDCVQADRILGQMEAAGSRVNIVILDACRNNPFERSWSRSMDGNGLAFMNAPSGSLIAYATSPGRTASDGSGANGLYTSALLENLQTPNITILQMFQNVRREVSERSYKQQIPWESTSLTADFYFVNANKTNASTGDIKTVVTWKHGADGYWFYLNNDEIGGRLKSAWSDDDLLVYDPVSGLTCLLQGYDNSPLNQVLKPKILGQNEDTWWRRKEGLFWLYVKGEQIAKRTKSVYIDNDVLVYDDPTNTTYILKDYTSRNDNQLRPAVLFDNAEFVFWRRQDKSYWLYSKGEEIQSHTKSGWVDDDLLVYDENTNITYLLEDYNNTENEMKLKPARVISYIDYAFWRKKEGLYYFYLRGEQIAGRTTSKWSGNDLLVTDTQTGNTYVFSDYNAAPENQLQPAVLSKDN